MGAYDPQHSLLRQYTDLRCSRSVAAHAAAHQWHCSCNSQECHRSLSPAQGVPRCNSKSTRASRTEDSTVTLSKLNLVAQEVLAHASVQDCQFMLTQLLSAVTFCDWNRQASAVHVPPVSVKIPYHNYLGALAVFWNYFQKRSAPAFHNFRESALPLSASQN